MPENYVPHHYSGIRYTKYSKAYKLLANWINVDVAAYLNKNVISIAEFPLSPEKLAGLVRLVETNEVNSNQAREIFAKMLEAGVDANKAKEMLGISSQISDLDFIKETINKVLEANPQAIIDYKEGCLQCRRAGRGCSNRQQRRASGLPSQTTRP